MGWLAESYRRLGQLFRRDIWRPLALHEHPVRGRVHVLLRVGSITWTGLFENHITTRAAALSYASLLGLGPLVAIAMLVAGFVLNQRDPTLAVNTMNRVIMFIAPQVAEYEHLDQRAGPPPASSEPGIVAANAPAGANPALVQFINNFVAGNSSTGQLPGWAPGKVVYYSQMASLVFDSRYGVPGVVSQVAFTLNSATSDITPTARQVPVIFATGSTVTIDGVSSAW